MEHYARKRPPTPRRAAFDIYWHFAAERQAAFEKRSAGMPGPWTEDVILQEYKFCNVFRAADRVSQYLISQVIYNGENLTDEDALFQIVAFRMFSNIDTWRGLIEHLGRPPVLRDVVNGKMEAALNDIRRKNGKLYTGAFILCANKAYGFDEKHRNHLALFKEMFLKGKLAQALMKAKSLCAIVELLESYPLMGPFMSYQIAIDLNYSALINFSENDYTQAGPGAQRGIAKVFESLGDFSTADTIQWMVERQKEEFAARGLVFKGLWGRPIHAIDAQGLFCETDKYCRQALPQLKSNRTRIKAKFAPAAERIEYFFPPKWGINERINAPAASNVRPR